MKNANYFQHSHRWCDRRDGQSSILSHTGGQAKEDIVFSIIEVNACLWRIEPIKTVAILCETKSEIHSIAQRAICSGCHRLY